MTAADSSPQTGETMPTLVTAMNAIHAAKVLAAAEAREETTNNDRVCGSQGVDEDGRCVRCGLTAPDPRLDTTTECPAGFFEPPREAIMLPAEPRTPSDSSLPEGRAGEQSNVLKCQSCRALLASYPGDAENLALNGGKIWEHCPNCRMSRWFAPFTIRSTPTDAEAKNDAARD